MDNIINKLIEHIKKNNIKYVTISESNHRSYTSHTFQYKLVKALYENKIINTFSSERLGINDAQIINYYLENKLSIEDMIEKLPFGGMGYYRIIKYLNKKPYNKYKIVGLEEDKFCYKTQKNLPKDLVLYRYHNEEEREKFWLKNIKSIIKERGNLFINGFHLNKSDIIGKYLMENYPKQTLILGMCAKEIITQILVIDNKEKDIDKAVMNNNYQMKVERVDKISPPTKLEENIEEWKLIKVTKKNQNQDIRAVGCYLALHQKEYDNNVNINSDVVYKIKNYDYVIAFKNSKYKEKMFY